MLEAVKKKFRTPPCPYAGDAWRQGYNVGYERSGGQNTNPYTHGSTAALEWEKGYMQGKHQHYQGAYTPTL